MMIAKLVSFLLVTMGMAFSSLPLSAQEASPSLSGTISQPGNLAKQESQPLTVSAPEAFAMIQQAARDGQAPAMYALGEFYEKGLGTNRNLSEALAWYQKAADSGLPEAYYQVGLCYEQGKGTMADQNKARENFNQAAEFKFQEASYKLVSLALSGPASKDGEQKALDIIGQMGNSPAQAQEILGTFYEQGAGVSINYSKAFKLYEQAAKNGSPIANFRLGSSYEMGLGVPVDGQRALACFQKARELKLPGAAYKMAAIYLTGSLVPADHKKTVDYLQEAANLGHDAAANELGIIYLDGRLGQSKNPDQALKWFTKSAELGNTEAMKNVAVIYRNALGREQDKAKALTWYSIAQARGYQTQGFEELLTELKRELKPDEVIKAEEQAKQWLEKFKKADNQ